MIQFTQRLGNLIIINDEWTTIKCIDMLKENLLDFAIEMRVENFILFFNKMIPNTSWKIIMKFFEENNIQYNSFYRVLIWI